MREIVAHLGRLPRSVWPLVIMLAVALGQTAASTRGPLTPWKGGGFAMFSSIDSDGRRTLVLTLSDADGNSFRPMLSGPPFHPRIATARAWPTTERLAALNRWALAQPWQVLSAPSDEDATASAWLPEDAVRSGLRPVRLLAVHCSQAEVLAPVYEPRAKQIRARRLGSQRTCGGR